MHERVASEEDRPEEVDEPEGVDEPEEGEEDEPEEIADCVAMAEPSFDTKIESLEKVNEYSVSITVHPMNHIYTPHVTVIGYRR